MKALVAALEPEFGPAKVFRPYRDVRFAKDKTPYKTHQGAYVGAGPSTGWYVEISARGTRVGAGFYDADGPRLAAIREAMADEKSGKALERLLSKLEKDGFEIGGDRLKTSPRGYDADHPRIELLRCKQLFAEQVLRLRVRRHRRRPGRPGPRGLEDPATAGRAGCAPSRPMTPRLLRRADARRPPSFTRTTSARARLAPWPRDCSCSTSVPTRSTSTTMREGLDLGRIAVPDVDPEVLDLAGIEITRTHKAAGTQAQGGRGRLGEGVPQGLEGQGRRLRQRARLLRRDVRAGGAALDGLAGFKVVLVVTTGFAVQPPAAWLSLVKEDRVHVLPDNLGDEQLAAQVAPDRADRGGGPPRQATGEDLAEAQAGHQAAGRLGRAPAVSAAARRPRPG